jgi:ribosomal protein L7/L12
MFAMTQQDLLKAASQLSVQELKDFVVQVTAIYQERQAGTISAAATHSELLAAIERVEQRQDLVTFTPESWSGNFPQQME